MALTCHTLLSLLATHLERSVYTCSMLLVCLQFLCATQCLIIFVRRAGCDCSIMQMFNAGFELLQLVAAVGISVVDHWSWRDQPVPAEGDWSVCSFGCHSDILPQGKCTNHVCCHADLSQNCLLSATCMQQYLLVRHKGRSTNCICCPF